MSVSRNGGASRLMSLDGRHHGNHIRNTPLKRQFRAAPFVIEHSGKRVNGGNVDKRKESFLYSPTYMLLSVYLCRRKETHQVSRVVFLGNDTVCADLLVSDILQEKETGS